MWATTCLPPRCLVYIVARTCSLCTRSCLLCARSCLFAPRSCLRWARSGLFWPMPFLCLPVSCLRCARSCVLCPRSCLLWDRSCLQFSEVLSTLGSHLQRSCLSWHVSCRLVLRCLVCVELGLVYLLRGHVYLPEVVSIWSTCFGGLVHVGLELVRFGKGLFYVLG